MNVSWLMALPVRVTMLAIEGNGRGRRERMKPRIDWVLFTSSVGLIVAVCIPMALAPERSSEVVGAMYQWIAGELGLLYQWMVIAATVVLAVIAFGKYGRIRLGGEHVAKEFSDLSWMSMLFCAGIGAGIMYWAPIEWAYYVDTPPFGAEPNSPEAQEWAATYGIFHWGLSAWCLYCLPTVAIAYPYYQRKIPGVGGDLRHLPTCACRPRSSVCAGTTSPTSPWAASWTSSSSSPLSAARARPLALRRR